MIPLDLFDYTEHNKVDLEITRYVNDNLAAMVRVLLDYLNDDPEFSLDFFFPRDYLNRRPNECRDAVNELYEMLTSNVLRDWIKPKYEFLLYNILCWWEDMWDDPSDLIPLPLEGDLLLKIKSQSQYFSEDGENIILEELIDYQSYYYFCFYDHDFLPDQISKIVTLFLRSPEHMQKGFSDINLDDYIDLMPADLRELYLEQKSTLIQNKTELDIEKAIVLVIYTQLKRFQKRVVEFQKRSEVEISNDIYDSIAHFLKINHGLIVSREATMGRSVVQLGETDLYIYKEEGDSFTDYAIVEIKNIENFLQQYRQLLGYLNHYFQFGITISINKKNSLEEAICNIENVLKNIDDKEFPIVRVDRSFDNIPYIIKSLHNIPEDKTRQMSIYHMIFHLNDMERKNIAKKARGK